MRFKNETKEEIPVRRGSTFKPEWIRVKPGKEVEVDEVIGLRKGLTKVKRSSQPAAAPKTKETNPSSRTEGPKTKRTPIATSTTPPRRS